LATSATLDFSVMREPAPELVRRMRRAGKISVALAAIFSLFSPLHWFAGLAFWGVSFASYTPTHVLGSTLSVILSLSLLLLFEDRAIRLGRILWFMIAALMAVILLEYITPNELPIAPYIRLLDPAQNQDKIAPNGALSLLLGSLSAYLFSKHETRSTIVAQTIAIGISLVALFAIIGHAYSVQSLYGVSDYSALTLPGALHYLFLSLALLGVRPDGGLLRILVMPNAAGVMSRRLYTAVIFVPPVLGFFALVSSEIWGWYNIPFAIALLALASILLLAAVIAFTSLRLERTDILRAKAEQDLRDSRERLRDLSTHIQVLQEEERVRIAREVHDELGQSLTALKMDVAMLTKQLPKTDEIERRTHSILDLVNGTIKSVQRISSELRPSLLDDLGLAAAIEWQAREFERRSGIDIILNLPADEIPLSKDRSTAIYRIFQETLTNVARHSAASHVEVTLALQDNTVMFSVQDDGIGLRDTELNGHSLGIMGMRERAALAGGMLQIDGSSGDGTTITVSMPIDNLSKVLPESIQNSELKSQNLIA
jgi:signal transduction histidine kinase